MVGCVKMCAWSVVRGWAGLGAAPFKFGNLILSESQVSGMPSRPVGLERDGRSGVTLLPLPTLTSPPTIGDTISRYRENFESPFYV